MWNLKLVCVALVAGFVSTDAVGSYASAGGYAGAGGFAGGGGYAGGYAGGSAGGYGGGYGNGGYIGSYTNSDDDYADDGYYGSGVYYAPRFGGGLGPGLGAGFIDPYLFHQQLTAHILAQNAAQTNAIQNRIYHAPNSHRYAPNYAAASGSVSPGGSYQTAYINPSNRALPNVVSRFSPSSGGDGYKGVSVSSFSSSADNNGKRTSHRAAQTTINDNGRITSYGVHS